MSSLLSTFSSALSLFHGHHCCHRHHCCHNKLIIIIHLTLILSSKIIIPTPACLLLLIHKLFPDHVTRMMVYNIKYSMETHIELQSCGVSNVEIGIPEILNTSSYRKTR